MGLIKSISTRNIIYTGNNTSFINVLESQSDKNLRFLVATSPADGLELIATTSVQVVIVDQQLGEASYLPFLTSLKSFYPDIIRIFVVVENDLNQIINAINNIEVYRFITPPSNQVAFNILIQEALQQYDISTSNSLLVNKLYASNKKLEAEIKSVTEKLKNADRNLQDAIEDNQKNLSFIEAIYNSVPGLLYLIDNEGRLVRLNKKFQTFLGYTEEELLNIHVIDLFDYDKASKTTIQSSIDTVISKGFAEVETRLYRKDGTYIPMHFTTVPVQIGGSLYFAGIGMDISQQKKIEKLLKSNYALIRVAGETAKFGGWSYKISNKKFEWSDSVRKIHDIPEGKTIHSNDIEHFLTHESLNVLPQAFELCLKNGIPYDLEVQIVTAKMRKVWVRVTGQAVKNKNGDIVMVQGSLQDINESKIINLALNESERKMSTLIGNLPGFVYRSAYDENWTMFYLSDVFEQVTGYKTDDLVYSKKLTFNDIIHPEHQSRLFKSWEQAIRLRKPFEEEYQIITSSGEVRWVWEHGIGVFDENNVIVHLEGFVLDITDRKNAQEALMVSEEKFSSLFRGMNDLAVFFNAENSIEISHEQFKILECNEAFLRTFNVQLKDIIGKSPFEFIGANNLIFQENLKNAVSYKRIYSFTTEFKDIDKKFQVTVMPLHQNDFAIIATDITELTHFNNVLMEKNNELENYVYVTSHDLRSPLVNIQGFSSRLKKQTDIIGKIVESCELDAEKRAIINESIEQKIPHTLDFIFNNVTKMELMLNGLLQLSRTGRVVMSIEQVDMRDLIVKVIQSVDHQLHEISSEILLGDLTDCYGDKNMLNQLFSNLLSNAIKYRHPERKLKISIDGVRRHRKVQFRVQNNGIGIGKAHLNKIWQVFFRVDNKELPGDGVGLSLVKRIVEKHKGKIWVESTEFVGSTFFIELPAEEFLN